MKELFFFSLWTDFYCPAFIFLGQLEGEMIPVMVGQGWLFETYVVPSYSPLKRGWGG